MSKRSKRKKQESPIKIEFRILTWTNLDNCSLHTVLNLASQGFLYGHYVKTKDSKEPLYFILTKQVVTEKQCQDIYNKWERTQ